MWGAGDDPPCDDTGMCGYGINEQSVGVTLSDTPAGYAPPIGPSAEVTLSYDQRLVSQSSSFGYFNVSQKWTLNWLSYIQDDPGNIGVPGATANFYERSGIVYPETGYDSSTRDFAPEQDDASVLSLEKTSPVTYQRFLNDGTVETYAESDGSAVYPRNVFLTKITDPQGNTLSLHYAKVSGQVRLSYLEDATGRETKFGYGSPISPLLVTAVTDPFGRSASLKYDSSSRLISITDVIGLTSSFTYDASSLIDKLTTPYGSTSFTYGTYGDSVGATDQRFLNIIDPLGYGEREETFEPAPVPSSEPDAPQGMPSPLFNSYLNYRDSFHWDKHQYAAGHCAPSGGCEYADARITHFVHDAEDISSTRRSTIESTKEPLENRVWYNYPGQTSGLGAGASGTYSQPSAIARVLDNGQTQLNQFAYDTAGNPTEFVDPVGRTTTLTYAANQIDVISVAQTDASGQQTIATFTYNGRHRPLTYTDAAGKTTTYTYNAAGQLVSATNPLGQKTSYAYDATGDLTEITNADGKTSASFTYDSFDRIASYTDAGGWTAGYEYDAADRLTEATYPDGTTDQYTYSRLDLVSYKDRQGHVWHYAYDKDRRLSSVTDPLGHKTAYTYYEDDSLKSVTDPDGHTTSWDIDVESRPTAKIYADGTAATYTYELTTSRLKAVTDALGQSKNYSYALDDQLAGISYRNALHPTPTVSFTYDPYFARLTAMTDGTGATTYSYAPVGSPGALSLRKESGPLPNGAIAYAYDALGRVVSRTVGGATPESFKYDVLSRLTGHTDALGKFALTYLGQTAQVTRRALSGGAVATAWSYRSNTDDRRLAGIANEHAGERQFSYTTTPEDLITKIVENKSGSLLQSWSLAYDKAYRLLSAASTTGAKYGYTPDPAGNITMLSAPSGSTTLTYNNVNELTNSGFVYDADGELVSDGARSYSWDAENRLVGISYTAHQGQKTSFSYDGLGRRVAITETPVSGAPTTTRYIWCGTQICQSRTGSGAVNRLYYDEGEVIPAATAANDTLFYYGPDQLGSVRDAYVASSLVSMVQAYDYDAYGNPTTTPASGPFTDFRYAGMFYHAASGLYLTETRAYDPRTGRWLSRDPEEEGDGVNLYEFLSDDPVTDIDPAEPWGSANAVEGAPDFGHGLDTAFEPMMAVWGGAGAARDLIEGSLTDEGVDLLKRRSHKEAVDHFLRKDREDFLRADREDLLRRDRTIERSKKDFDKKVHDHDRLKLAHHEKKKDRDRPPHHPKLHVYYRLGYKPPKHVRIIIHWPCFDEWKTTDFD